jgi:hypothetical protein
MFGLKRMPLRGRPQMALSFAFNGNQNQRTTRVKAVSVTGIMQSLERCSS